MAVYLHSLNLYNAALLKKTQQTVIKILSFPWKF